MCGLQRKSTNYIRILKEDIMAIMGEIRPSDKPIELDCCEIHENLAGRLSIQSNGKRFEALWLPKEDCHTLFVVLNGSRPVNSGPVFKRWSWNRFIPGSVLNIDDPMYIDYPELTLGWYYGSAHRCYCEDIVEIVRQFMKVYLLNDVFFYGSSGGGTAAILSGAIMGSCTVIGINPQIFIGLYEYSAFSEITGVDLRADDCLGRNNLGIAMKNALSTKFILCENIISATDNKQIKHLYELLYKDNDVEEGLNRLSENIIVWNYKAEAFSSKINQEHNSQEWEAMFWAIIRLKEIWSSLNNSRDFSDWQKEYKNYNRFWTEHWLYEKRIKELNRKIAVHISETLPAKRPVYNNPHIVIRNCKADKWVHTKIDYEFKANSYYCLCISDSDVYSNNACLTLVVRDMLAEKVVVSKEIKTPYTALELITFGETNGMELRLYPTKLGDIASSDEVNIFGLCIWENCTADFL